MTPDSVDAILESGSLFYQFGRGLTWTATKALGCVVHMNVPRAESLRGGMMFVANHQSFLDPMLVGQAVPRSMSFLARSTLFEVPLFGRLISAVNAHPVKRGAADAQALKTVIRLLRGGESVLMFPEGTRTRDGQLGRFKSGAAAIAIRCGVPVLPVAIEGAYDCWPRTRALPRAARMAVAYGRPRPTDGAEAEALTGQVKDDIESMLRSLRAELGRRAEGRNAPERGASG
jgi:1-acyl-sn-glycerol-3-phosphate acyltransferase